METTITSTFTSLPPVVVEGSVTLEVVMTLDQAMTLSSVLGRVQGCGPRCSFLGLLERKLFNSMPHTPRITHYLEMGMLTVREAE